MKTLPLKTNNGDLEDIPVEQHPNQCNHLRCLSEHRDETRLENEVKGILTDIPGIGK
jgi:hypothetical protein